MKKVLLVSPYPYSHSSRGMDVLTRCFEKENWETHHLVYPRAFYTPKVKAPEISRVILHRAELSWIPYIDSLMFWFPPLLFNLVKFLNNRTARHIDFSDYDQIVLESGKALFLMDLIPRNIPLIYRLSDSVRFVLGRNPSYHRLEELICERAPHLVFKKSVYKIYLTPEQQEKVTVIENGMVIPENMDPSPAFTGGEKNAVYVGLHRLDYATVNLMLKENPLCSFHIIGPCLRKKEIKKLSAHGNFHYYPFLAKEKYMPMLRDSNLAVFPFKRSPVMEWFGLTSKFLHFMFFRLPIVSYPTGGPGEFDNLPVKFALTPRDFSRLVSESLMKGEKIDYPIDFNFYSQDAREEEYRRFIRTLESDRETDV